ncbi:MAG: DUF1127 domain-containing protein [Rhodospirillaceae bacterium]
MSALLIPSLKIASSTGYARLFRRARTAMQALERRRRASQTASALRSLSDAALKDIGLHRSEADSVAAGWDDRLR